MRTAPDIPGQPPGAVADRDSFLLALDDRLRSFTDPEDMLAETAAILGRRLGCSRVGYAQIDQDAGTLTAATGCSISAKA
jgi:hypothetical protein